MGLNTFLALVLGTFASEDLTTIAAGLLVQRGEVSFVAAVGACALGIWVGDLGLWLIGRGLGTRAAGLLWRPAARGTRHDFAGGAATLLEHLRAWLDRHAVAAIVGSRFAPGTRLPLYIAAGACGTSFGRFAWWSLVAVGIWTPVLLGSSAVFGEQVSTMADGWLGPGRAVIVAIAVVAFLAWRSMLRALSSLGVFDRLGPSAAHRPGRSGFEHHRRTRSGAGQFRIGRGFRKERLIARVSRIWRWEFWPMWLFYAPVAIWTMWLAWRYGGFRTITAANPGMPDGGVVGESKFEILSRLPPQWTIPAVLVASGSLDMRIETVRAGLLENGWAYPVVLKPDVGQRGAGVRLACNAGDVVEYLAQMPGPIVMQPYNPGPFEAGIFYYRLPHWTRGRILCITDKHFPAVTGDGRSTTGALIWGHERYRMQATTFLARLGPRSEMVPAAGERVALGMAGNHAQGAMFRDGRMLVTPALEARIDAIAREYDGFYIGRFDVRYSSREAFMAGQDLAIVELNGATAECTNIYDPDNSLLAAYRQLFLQWRLVFEIGAANRDAGRPVSSTERLLALLRAHLLAPVLPIAD